MLRLSIQRKGAPLSQSSRQDVLNPDAPFADVYRAHGEVLAALKALNDAAQHPVGDRLQTLMSLDENSRALQQRLSQQYFHGPAGLHRLDETLWNKISSLSWQLKRGYRAILRQHYTKSDSRQSKSNLALITARALHHSGASFKWGYIRNLPVDPKSWQNLHKLYRTSERGSFSAQKIRLYEQEHMSCSEQYIRILLLDLLSPLSFSPTQIEIADQWLRNCVGCVRLEDAYTAGKHLFCVDLATPTGVRKVDSGVTGEKLRFLDMDELLRRVDQFIAGSDDLTSLSELNVVKDWQQAMGLELASPARNQWQATSVMRPHPKEAAQETQKLFKRFRAQWSGLYHRRLRKEIRQTVEVAYGVSAICASLLSEDCESETPRASLPWEVHNLSQRGYGLCAHPDAQAQLKVYDLVGIRGGFLGPEWDIGIIRRVSHERPEQTAVGVESLKSMATRVELRSIDRAVLTVASAAVEVTPSDIPTVAGILLSDAERSGRRDSLVLPLADYPSRHFDLRDGDRISRIRLATILDRTATWIRVEFDEV